MVSTKECMDVWSARLLLNPHSAQNPLDVDNEWMHANLETKSTGIMVKLWHQLVYGTFGNSDVSNGTNGKHTQL